MKSYIFIPDALKCQLGSFEKEIIEQDDAKITDFEEPFGCSSSLNRMRNAKWIVSEKLGKAFKYCLSSKKIIEYSTR